METEPGAVLPSQPIKHVFVEETARLVEVICVLMRLPAPGGGTKVVKAYHEPDGTLIGRIECGKEAPASERQSEGTDPQGIREPQDDGAAGTGDGAR